jgi:hypothetical protein
MIQLSELPKHIYDSLQNIIDSLRSDTIKEVITHTSNESNQIVHDFVAQYTFTDKLILGLIVGIVSTFCYFLIAQIVKPRIKIGKEISMEKDGIYRIKFINKTFFNIEKISLDLFLMKQYTVDNNGNMNYNLTRLNLTTPNYTFLRGVIKKDKKVNNNCIQSSIIEDLGDIWTDKNDILIFQVCAYHTLSGNRRICRRRFHHPESTIKKGRFKSGNTMEIIQ